MMPFGLQIERKQVMKNKETAIEIAPEIESEFTDNRGNDEPKEGEDHE